MKVIVCDICGDKCQGIWLQDDFPVRMDGDFCPRCHKALMLIAREEEAKFKAAVSAKVAEAKPKLRDACRSCGGSGSVSDSFPDGEGGETQGKSTCWECTGTGLKNGNQEGATK